MAHSPFARLILFGGLLLLVAFGLGQPHQRVYALETHTLIKDIAFGNQGSFPALFTAVGDLVFFTAFRSTPGFDVELFVYNTTTQTTSLVKDINPGNFGGFNTSTSQNRLVNAGGTLYFIADDGTNGRELWKSDGTEAGTVMVKDINVGSGNGVVFGSPLVAMGSKVYFVGDTGSTGSELWVSDGTEVGTIQLTNFAGTSSGIDTSVNFAVMGGFLYFSGGVTFTGAGRELWRTDGTVVGTTQVKDINPGDSNSFVENLTAVGSTLYFTAVDGTHGRELWKSDGSEGGTVLVKDINPSGDSTPQQLTALGTILYFTATDGSGRTLWRSNGTDAGTMLAPNFSATGLNPASISRLTAAAGGLAFYNLEGNERVLWEYNGAAAPKRCQDASGRVVMNSFAVLQSAIAPQTYLNMVYLAAYHPDFGVEMARCVPGSSLPNADFYDLTPGPDGGWPSELRVIGDFAYFGYTTEANGSEPHRYNPFAANSFALLGDIITATSSSSPAQFKTVGQKVFFSATTNVHGGELWVSDGTTAGTQLVKNINPYTTTISGPLDFHELGGYLYFTASDGFNGREWWRTDGSAGGTVQVTQINGFFDGVPIGEKLSVVYNGKLYFMGGTGNSSSGDGELWVYDPATETTEQVIDLVPGAGGSYPQQLTVFNGLIYFNATTPATGSELWATDGTAGGTVLVKDIRPGTDGSFPTSLFAIGNTLYFAADDFTHGQELWKSDGTEAGTVLLKDILPGSEGTSFFNNFFEFNGKLVFSAGGHYETIFRGYRPWISDGTPGGTHVLKGDHLNENDVVGPTAATGNFGQLGNNIYFGAQIGMASGGNGIELWISDGTTTNTNLLSDINVGSDSSLPDQFITLGTRLFFLANDGIVGRELWFLSPSSIFPQFSGFDINPGANDSSIGGYGDLNGIVLIRANDGVHGIELHAFRGYYPVYLPNIIR